MRSYQINYYEVFMDKASSNDRKLTRAYNKLFDELLDFRALSRKRIFEAFDFSKNSISSKPIITEPLLHSKLLPDFVFLICSN